MRPVTDAAPPAHALIRFSMNSPDAPRLVQFYEQAFGARTHARRRQENSSFAPQSGISRSAEHTLLSLGEATVELVQFDDPGRPYPRNLSPYDTRFQHLGIVVTDMRRAVERLSQTGGWSAISTGGPQTLPDAAGGVTAFKFRDPDGHPFEFLQFAAGKLPTHWQPASGEGRLWDPAGNIHQGIDHSALSVADAQRSVRFFESLGLRQATRTLNHGSAQERLDGVSMPTVDVIGLALLRSTPHVELLHYHAVVRPIHDAPAVNDVAATRLVFAIDGAADGRAQRLIQDPDGHFLQFE